MSMSLRDQLLQVGLISQKQAKDAERQEQRQKHQQPKPKRGAPAVQPARPAPDAKAARDQVLNRKQQEKAQRKAKQAEIKQLIEQNRLPQADSDEGYNFVDGNKIRRIKVGVAAREPLIRGALVIVRHDGRYDLVPAPIAARIRERDASAVIELVVADSPPIDEAYREFTVPDDLMW